MESKEKKVIAHVVGKWVGGGVESVIINYYKHIDKSEFQFHFICDEDSTKIPEDFINNLGGKVILVPPYQNIFRYVNELIKIFKKNKYDIVHSHLNSLSVFPLFCAKKAKVPIRIAHSHSTTNRKEILRNIFKNILRIFSKIYATNYFACSESAGIWLFGKRAYKKGKITIINNAIGCEKFQFNSDIRNKIRESLNISKDEFVIGNIGRFVKQKNHIFVIKIFKKIIEINPKAKLILIGEI